MTNTRPRGLRIWYTKFENNHWVKSDGKLSLVAFLLPPGLNWLSPSSLYWQPCILAIPVLQKLFPFAFYVYLTQREGRQRNGSARPLEKSGLKLLKKDEICHLNGTGTGHSRAASYMLHSTLPSGLYQMYATTVIDKYDFWIGELCSVEMNACLTQAYCSSARGKLRVDSLRWYTRVFFFQCQRDLYSIRRVLAGPEYWNLG
jgi:hypothetical protein